MTDALKPGWRRWRFDQMATNVNVRVDDPREANVDYYVGLEHLDSDSLKIRRWGSPEDVTATKLLFEPGDIIFGRRRAYQRKLGVAEWRGIASAHSLVLRSKPDVVLPEFLPFFMQSDLFMERAQHISVGSLSPTINWKTLAKQEFALPPLEEQRRRLRVYQTASAVGEYCREAERNASNTEYALLLREFGVANAPSNLSVALATVAHVRTGAAKGLREGNNTVALPYLRVANVLDGELDLQDIKEIVVRKGDVAKYQLRNEDVLMTEGGDLDKLGRGTVWQNQLPQCLHQNHVFALQVDRRKLLPWYLAAANRSPYGRQYFLAKAKRTSNLATINKTDVERFRIPLPGINWQQAFIERWFEVCDARRELQQRQANAARMLSALVAQGLNA